ncbi:MAG: flagellar basal body L-ring protein FlgH, partial [Proteobacteria bacterium]|nr:flagellar basal body L-ring protein FlgH [Pseudomonadota bacterium]
GSLFHTQSPVSLFADQRARQLGDVLTIRLEERTQARTSSSTETSKGTEISLPNPTLFGAPVTRGGNPLLTTDVASDNAFNGSGASEQTNQLDGFITAQVVDITPNGLLRVHGEKRLRINRGDETIVLTGLVRPQDIGPDNTVPSLRVADADISYRGRGQLGQANQQGWLGRFFNSPLWPF